MLVELNVQDCFDGEALAPGEPPVSLETWEIWFGRWLKLLDPKCEDGLPLQADEHYELSLRLTDDREIQTLNHQYRQKNQPTDVLAFAALEVDYPQFLDELEDSPLYLGDLVISIETAAQQATQQKHSLQVELAWLAAHGLLHLLGWDHPDDESLSRMLEQQRVLLQAVGLVTQV
ncbi:rRNA maturation RNase YbeY [Phormidesmis sp. 146-35]